MPDGPERYVTWDRWDEAHQRLGDRIKYLEDKCDELETAQQHRTDRAWTLAIAFLTGLALPLVMLGITALLQRRG